MSFLTDEKYLSRARAIEIAIRHQETVLGQQLERLALVVADRRRPVLPVAKRSSSSVTSGETSELRVVERVHQEHFVPFG